VRPRPGAESVSSSAAELWIVHRDERLRAALRRLAGAGEEARVGGPDDAGFRDAPPPRVVLLGLAGDFEAELEFAHRQADRLPAARWLLLVDPFDREDAERLFDTLPAEWLAFPPTGVELRRRLRSAARRRRQDELSQRRLRDDVALRFARTFADLELDEVLRALDPRLASVPFLVRGEPGTGRGLLARYVHVFGGAGGRFLELDGRTLADPRALRAALAEAASQDDLTGPGGVTVCVREVDAAPAAVQYALRACVECGAPGPLARARRVRWMATAGDDVAGLPAPGLAPELAEAIAGLSVRLPPLRERVDALARFALDAVAAWCRAHGERARRLASETIEALEADPWPGNHRELEAVLARTLAAVAADPIRPEHLRFDDGAGWAGTSVPRPALRPRRPEPEPDEPREPVRPAWLTPPGAAREPVRVARGAPAAEPGREPLDGRAPEPAERAPFAGRGPEPAGREPLSGRAPEPPGREPSAGVPTPPTREPLETWRAAREAEARRDARAAEARAPVARPERLAGPAPEGLAAAEPAAEAPPGAAPAAAATAEPRAEPTPPAEPARVPGAASGASAGPAPLVPLAQALAHELRNRLVAIRTFAALLPERADDRGFRDEFSRVVGADVQRMERSLDRLAAFAALPTHGAREPVDVAGLLDEQLDAFRGEIEARRLLVLKELDRTQPAVRAHRAALAFAFEALLARAFAWMPDRGDLYLASKTVAPRGARPPSVRVVLRFHRPGERAGAPGGGAPSDREVALEVVLAELALRGQGASLRVEATDAEETVVAIDLPGA